MEQLNERAKRTLKEAKDLLDGSSIEDASLAREKLLEVPEASNTAIYHLMLAKAAKILGQKTAALSHLEKSLEINPKNTQAAIRVSEEKIRQGNMVGVAEYLNVACAALKEGSDVKSIVKIAGLYLKIKDYKKALEIINFASDIAPNDREVLYTQALTHREMGDSEQYVLIAEKALERCPLETSYKQRLSVAKYYVSNSMFDKVLTVLCPLDDLSEDPKLVKYIDLVWIIEAIAHCEMNTTQKAREHMIRVKNSGSIPANLAWANIYNQESNVEDAIAACKAVQDLARRKIKKISEKKKTASERLKEGQAGAANDLSNKILNVETEYLQQIANFPLENVGENDLYEYLNIGRQLLLHILPG